MFIYFSLFWHYSFIPHHFLLYFIFFLTGKERQLSMNELPSPESLYDRYKNARKIDAGSENVLTTPYYTDSTGKDPRYYQQVAINRTIQAVVEGQKRILLVMATGTGKTYTMHGFSFNPNSD